MNSSLKIISIPLLLFTFVLTEISFLQPAFAQEYEVIDLGRLDSQSTKATGINNLGQVIGTSGSYAFIWENGTMTNLGSFGGTPTNPYGINDIGQVVGEAKVLGGTRHAFVWENGSMYDIHYGQHNSLADDINNAGRIVGHAFFEESYNYRACLWDNDTVTNLGTIENGWSKATGINNLGQICGWASIGSNDDRSFVWESGTITPLGSLNSGVTHATAINDKGQIVGQSGSRAFLWEDSIMVSLPSASGFLHYANDINNHAQVVGELYRYAIPKDIRIAVLWQNNTLINLNDVIDPNSEWELLSAVAINDLGQIVGYGTIGDDYIHRAFLMTLIPEPLTIILYAIGLFGLFSLSSFKQKKV